VDGRSDHRNVSGQFVLGATSGFDPWQLIRDRRRERSLIRAQVPHGCTPFVFRIKSHCDTLIPNIYF
jgi:hypothetical protein